MYLHLGQDVIISEDDVIGIFDLDNTTGSRITREFLSDAEKEGRVTSVSDELPNSFVVCDEEKSPRRTATVSHDKEGKSLPPKTGKKETDDGVQVYLSQLSPQTLLKRSENTRYD